MLKAGIFDLDGIIVNTVPLHFEAWKKMFHEYGYTTFDFEDYKKKVDGIPRTDGAKAIMVNNTDEEIAEGCARKQEYFLEFLHSKEIPVFQTTVDLIEQMISEGVKVAVISSSKNCIPILKKIGLYDRLDTVVDGRQITKGKPDPQVFLLAAERVNARPEECVVFEDAELGVEAAKRGHMACVGVDRYGSLSSLKRADIYVDDVGEVTLDKIREIVGAR
ncbi:MAG: beta-phosphoglucomutase family hydrolase [Elusimicrobiota bacterium]